MLSLPEDITSFTKKGRKGYYTFLSYISFSFLFLLDKRYILSKAFHAITESHLGQQGVLDMKKVLFNSFIHFPIQNYQIGTKKFGYLDMK